ncbi:glycosyltransferase [uncultured Zobellia sp.]|uniref:glycosyltransferase n=1 Tax=uncultured Zobellia sp. TaxID=255433 RepID=UPI0025968EB4|nr:glycosyltransferase [uncultured Zobellia sp.]
MLAPICLFTYNRLEETKLTVAALKNNALAADSHVIVFSDGFKNDNARGKVEKVRQYLKTIDGFKSVTVIESPKNKGLANSIISGATQVVKEYGKVIVLEDDLITSPNFLTFMNQALDYYESNELIKSINGFSPAIKSNNTSDVYFQTRTFPWGWATWKSRWSDSVFSKEKIKSEISSDSKILKDFRKECGEDIVKMLLDSVKGKNDSWYVRWVYEHFRTNTVALYPKYTLVENSGFNENGTHCKTINPYKSITNGSFREKENFNFSDSIGIEHSLKKQFLKYFSKQYRLGIRVKLLFEKGGFSMLLDDVKSKLK